MGMGMRELAIAIQHHIDTNMDYETAEGMAEHALGFFGYYDRIIDNALEPTDRNLFYIFQDYDLLTTESEETTLWDGRDWRIHYWKFKPELKQMIENYASDKDDGDDDPYLDIFTHLPSHAWAREGVSGGAGSQADSPAFKQ